MKELEEKYYEYARVRNLAAYCGETDNNDYISFGSYETQDFRDYWASTEFKSISELREYFEANCKAQGITYKVNPNFSESVFNEVDNLVLSTLCYLDFEEIVPRKGEGMITIQQAANQYFSIHGLPNCPDEEKATPLELREWMLYLICFI